MADDLKTVDTPAPETEERQVRIRGQEHTIRVPKGLTDDEIKRRLVAKSMAPSQTDFGTDVGYGILEGIGAVGARQLGENILEKSGVIPQAPAAPGAGQEGVVTDAKVPSGEPEGVTGGRLLGNVMGGAGMGGAIGAGMKLLPEAGSLVRGIAGGAVPAALQPVDESKDYWKTKAQQAATGVGLGWGFSVAGKGASVGTNALLKFLTSRLPQGTVEDKAVAQVLDRINSGTKYGGATAQQMMELMNRTQAAGKPMTIADVGDRAVLSLAAHASRYGEGQQYADQFLSQRSEAAFDRLLNDIGVHLYSGRTARQTAQALAISRDAAAKPFYEITDNLKFAPSEDINLFIGSQTPAGRNIRKGIALGYEIESNMALGRREEFDPTMLGIYLKDIGAGETEAGFTRVPNMRVLDMGKRGLDAMIAKERNEITGKLTIRGKSLVQLKKGYVEMLDSLDPSGAYKKAREAWGGYSASMDAVTVGQNAFRSNPEEIAEDLAAMSESDREFARIGLADTMRERLAKTGLGTDASRALLKNNGWTKAQVRPFFKSDDDYYNFIQAVNDEHAMQVTRNEVLKGSRTSRDLAADAEAGASGVFARGVSTARHFLEQRFFQTVRELYLMHRDYVRTPDPELNNRVARLLFSPNIFDTPLGQRLLAETSMPQAMKNYLAGTPTRIQDVLEPALAGGTSAAVAGSEGRPKRSVVRKRDPLAAEQ